MKRTFRVSVTSLVALAATLVLAQVASAHAHVSPPVVVAKQSQVFTLAVPTEKENATTTTIEFTPPAGFNIDSFVPSPGWKRVVRQSGSGDNAVIQKITYSGGNVPTGEDSTFSFLASPSASKTYTFGVQQTYSDGSVVDWAGPESSDTPAPTIEARSSLGGGGGSSTLAIVALIVGALGLVLGIVSLLAGGKRALA
ncbi:MAG: DUF1775 domain-containing protein [Gaiellaceae bacterium]